MVPSFYPAYSYGGPIRSTLELCRHAVELGCEVRVLTTDANGLDRVLDVEKNEEVEFPEGFRVRYCRRRQRHSVSPTLIRLLPTYMRWADVVHLTGVYNFPTFPTIFWARLLNKRLVWSPRGGLQRWKGSSRVGPKALWDFLWYHTADRDELTMHVTSELESCETLARFPKLRMATIPNGVDVPVDLNRVERTEDLRLLFIGRLDPKKGIESLPEGLQSRRFSTSMASCDRGLGATGVCLAPQRADPRPGIGWTSGDIGAGFIGSKERTIRMF